VGLGALAATACAGGAAEERPARGEQSPAPRPPAIVERAIAHHGGALYEGTRSRFRLCSRGGCFEVEAARDGDLFEYIVAGASGGTERRVRWTNESVERWDDGLPVPLDENGARRAKDFVMARVYFAYLPFRLLDPGVQWEDQGIETWEGQALHRVRVTFAPGTGTHDQDEYLYWFEPETGKLAQFAYRFTTGAGGLRFRTAHDYRRVGGILFYDQENFGVDGRDWALEGLTPDKVRGTMRHISTVTLEGIEVEATSGSLH
jgi:hypothetical protein